MMDLKNTLESLLFSSGKKMGIDELSKLSKESDIELIKKTLEELKKELDEKNSSLMLVQEGDYWKLTVREKYLPFVRKIVTQTELPKSILETLAVVAFKAPALQSEVIKIRTNKAYKHLDELEETGYITREKKGRTKLIKMTSKFFEYFDIPESNLKEKLKAAAEKEPFVIGSPETPKVEVYTDELNNLEVYDAKAGREKKIRKRVPDEGGKESAEAEEALQEDETGIKEDSQAEWSEELETGKEKAGEDKEKYKPKGIFKGKIPEELEKRIDKRVEEIVTGKEEGEENAFEDEENGRETQIEETEEEAKESEEAKREESALESGENNKTKDEGELTEEESEEQAEEENSEEE